MRVTFLMLSQSFCTGGSLQHCFSASLQLQHVLYVHLQHFHLFISIIEILKCLIYSSPVYSFPSYSLYLSIIHLVPTYLIYSSQAFPLNFGHFVKTFFWLSSRTNIPVLYLFFSMWYSFIVRCSFYGSLFSWRLIWPLFCLGTWVMWEKSLFNFPKHVVQLNARGAIEVQLPANSKLSMQFFNWCSAQHHHQQHQHQQQHQQQQQH